MLNMQDIRCTGQLFFFHEIIHGKCGPFNATHMLRMFGLARAEHGVSWETGSGGERVTAPNQTGRRMVRRSNPGREGEGVGT